MNIRNIQVGDIVTFDSGNFAGLTGEVKNVDWNSSNPRALYGYYHEVKLSNGNTGYIEKGEHIESIKRGGRQIR